MNCAELQMFLNDGDDLFASLERETLTCLKSLESMSTGEIEQFLEKRRLLLNEIQNFDTAFRQQLDLGILHGEKELLDRFRQRQAALLSRVLEADGLMIALAEMGITSFKAKLADISKGRGALQGYNEEGATSRSSLKCII